MKFSKMIKSFDFGFKGFAYLLKSENNFHFHFIATIIVLFCGFWLNVSMLEWGVLIIQIAAVFSAEAFNTAIEKLCDFVSPEWEAKIGKVKDLAAAGVLIVAISSIFIALLVFGNKIIAKF